MPPNNPYFSTPDPQAPVQPATPQAPVAQPAPAIQQPGATPQIGIPPTQVPSTTPVAQPVAPQPFAQPAPQPMAQAVPQQPAPASQPQQQAVPPKPTPKNPNSTQSLLQFSELRDNLIIMQDGSFRAVVTCKSINFDLMSDAEREGIEMSYQNFLNSLNFPIQIVVRSQRVDIGPYLDKLLDIRNNQDNMLLGVLMDDYINFIDQISQESNIMAKSFFIVVPYFPDSGEGDPLTKKSKSFFEQMFPAQRKVVTKIDRATYEKAKEEISNRVGGVMSGLYQIGIQSVQLNTKELGELYYNFYNPDTAVRQPLGSYSDIASTYVRKGTQ